MSVIRPRPPEEPLEVEGVSPAAAAEAGHAERIAAALAAVVDAPDDPATRALRAVDTLLADYGITRSTATRRDSRLFALLGAAREVAAAADRIVVIGPAVDLAGLRLVLAACAHPWHDHLGRGERGGRPRLAFLPADPAPDPDALAGLVDLLGGPATPAGGGRDLLDRAALVVIGRAGDAPLRDAVAVLGPAVEHRVTWVADGADGGAAAGAGAPLAPAGLLAGALAGIDVVRLLVGAAALVARCRGETATSPVAMLVRALAGPASPRSIGVDASALGPLTEWYGHLLHTAGVPAALVTHGDPSGDAVRILVRGGRPRRTPVAGAPPRPAVAVPPPGAPCRSVVVRLPRVDEHSLGQLVALLILTTAVERRLTGADGPRGERCGGAVRRL